jgi:hypothetical protein
VQSRRSSFVEAATNVGVGIIVAWAVTFAVFPLFDYEPTIAKSLYISLMFTVVNLARSYVLRRIFERIGHRKSHELWLARMKI